MKTRFIYPELRCTLRGADGQPEGRQTNRHVAAWDQRGKRPLRLLRSPWRQREGFRLGLAGAHRTEEGARAQRRTLRQNAQPWYQHRAWEAMAGWEERARCDWSSWR